MHYLGKIRLAITSMLLLKNKSFTVGWSRRNRQRCIFFNCFSALETNNNAEEVNDITRVEISRRDIYTSTSIYRPTPKISQPMGTFVKGVYNYTQQFEDDLTFNKGDKMVLIENVTNETWWLVKKVETKEEGYVPSTFVALDNRNMETQEWWFSCDKGKAEEQLQMSTNSSGTFLIRPNEDTNSYILSVLARNDERDLVVINYPIQKMDNESFYIMTKKIFADICELVDYYCVQPDGLISRLMNPCPKPTPPIPIKNMELKRTDFILTDLLGKGCYGVVYAGRFKNSLDVAVKLINADDLTTDTFRNEAAVIFNLRHLKLVKLIGYCVQDHLLLIVMEQVMNGVLTDVLSEDGGKTIDFNTIVNMAAQIADGMSYLEKKNCVHGYLRAQNILVEENFVVKIADFCVYRLIYLTSEGAKYPVKWSALEVLRSGQLSMKSDVWSFGIVLYELVTYGKMPYPDMNSSTVAKRIIDGYRMPLPEGENVVCPKELYDIMCSCWNANPQQRPTFEHLLNIFDDYEVCVENQWAKEELSLDELSPEASICVLQ